MNKFTKLGLAVIFSLAFVFPAQAGEDVEDANPYQDSVIVPIQAVPKHVMETALQAEKGIYFTRAIQQLHDSDTTYHVLYGTRVKSFWIVTVRSDGELISVQEESEAPSEPGRD